MFLIGSKVMLYIAQVRYSDYRGKIENVFIFHTTCRVIGLKQVKDKIKYCLITEERPHESEIWLTEEEIRNAQNLKIGYPLLTL